MMLLLLTFEEQRMPSHWRTAGVTYSRYANLAATAVRNALKEPYKSKAVARAQNPAKITEYRKVGEVKK